MAERQDTKLESEGAEFLVLGNLLLEGISCFNAYTNFQGYDLVAVNPQTKRQARIQVKSRWATNYDRSFPIKNFDCEFVVHVALNRGYRFGKQARTVTAASNPQRTTSFPSTRSARRRTKVTNGTKSRLRTSRTGSRSVATGVSLRVTSAVPICPWLRPFA